ncbi:IS1634 family transposase [Candidatus Poribacteria bacterium]|nr:IS1634 family transposase [Candidatus Poribacteria bacterium]
MDFGNIYFLKEICKQVGITEILQEIVPEKCNEILSLVYYTLCECDAYYLASKWSEFNYLDIKPEQISSQRISELLEKIGYSTDIKINFFKKWIQTQGGIDAIYFDITSISTHAKMLDLAEWGYNRDKEKLRQINIGLVYGSKTQLPLYYQIYPGSIPDVTTLANIKKYNQEFDIKNTIYILDRGFYSKNNIEKLDNERVIIPLSFSTSLASELLSSFDIQLNNPKNMIMVNNSIYTTVKSEIKISDKKFEVYIFRNKQMYNEGETLLYKILIELEEKINIKKYTNKEMVEQAVEEIASGYTKYFIIKENNNTYSIERNETIILNQIKKIGTFILMTNVSNQSKTKILELYKRREDIEKVFDCIKNDIDRDRLRVHTTERAEGNIFITYLSLILTSHIERTIKETDALKNYTKKEIIYELKKLKLTQFTNKLNIINELSKKVKVIYKSFNIDISNQQHK